MEIDERLTSDYEGNIRCDLCKRELEVGETVEAIQQGMYIETGGLDDPTMVQYGEDQNETVICKDCSPKVKVIVTE